MKVPVAVPALAPAQFLIIPIPKISQALRDVGTDLGYCGECSPVRPPTSHHCCFPFITVYGARARLTVYPRSYAD